MIFSCLIVFGEGSYSTLASVDSLNCTWIGWLDTGFAEDVYVVDSFAYVADGAGGVKVANVSNYFEPVIVDSFKIKESPGSYALKITVVGNNAYVAWDDCGLIVLDISNPYDLSLKYRVVSDHVKEVYVVREYESENNYVDYAYVGTERNFIIYKITDYNYQKLSSIDGVCVHGLHVAGNYAYLADELGYLHIVNISNKFFPSIVKSIKLGIPWDVFVEGDYAYVIDKLNGFIIMNILNINSPYIVTQYNNYPIDVPEEGNVYVVKNDLEKVAYIGLKSFGLIIFDVSAPSNIKLIGNYGDKNFAYGAIGTFPVNNIIYSAFYKNGLLVIEHLKDGYKFNLTVTPDVLKYEDTTNLLISLTKDYGHKESYSNAIIYLEDRKGDLISDKKIPNDSGEVNFELLKMDTFPIYVVAEVKIPLVDGSEQIITEKEELRVDYKIFKNVLKPKDVPVLKDNKIYIRVLDEVDTIKGISGFEVLLTDSQPNGFYFKGITNKFGQVFIPAYLKSNRPLYLTIDGVGYVPYISTIDVYLWSKTPETFGKNNQEHLVRKPNTDEMNMVYTTGDSVVFGKSTDFGQTWDLEILGEGTDPVLTRTSSGLISVMRKGSSSYYYTIRTSPWTPVDSMVSPTLWWSEPVLGYNYTIGKTYLGYINHRYLQSKAGDYILVSMDELNTEDIYYDTVVSYLGDTSCNEIPMNSPILSLYYDGIYVSHLIGFIDTLNEYAIKTWDLKLKIWLGRKIINNPNQICNAPTTDYYGEVTTFTYEVINPDGTNDIYSRRLKKGILDAGAVKINTTTGKNEYPKTSNGILINYISDKNKLITNYGGTDICIYKGADSIHSTEFETKQIFATKIKGYHIWSEGSNGNYRIKWLIKDYSPAIIPYLISQPQDTIDRVTISPLYEYISSRIPVERLNTTINGLNPEMNYTIKVITSEGSPVMSQVIQIDGEVYAVVTGQANKPDTTEILLPKEVYEDYKVVVSIDRKRGNPNRIADVLVYQYETEGEGIISALNKIKVFTQVNDDETKMKTKNLFSMREDVYVNYISTEAREIEIMVYDVRGSKIINVKREVKSGVNKVILNGINASGIYFVKIKDGNSIQTKKINIIR